MHVKVFNHGYSLQDQSIFRIIINDLLSSSSENFELCTDLSPKIFQSLESDNCLDTRDTKSVLEGESFRSIRFGFANELLPNLLFDIFRDRCRRPKCRI